MSAWLCFTVYFLASVLVSSALIIGLARLEGVRRYGIEQALAGPRWRLQTTQTEFWYPVLFRVGETLLDEATSRGEDWRRVPALVTLYASFEGFLNTLGAQLLPDLWKDERTFFSQDNDYRGTLGKYKKLAEHVGLQGWDLAKRPHQTIRVLGRIRDRLAHPRIEEDKWKEDLRLHLDWRSTELQKLIRRNSVLVVEDLVRVCADLRNKAAERFTGEGAILPINSPITTWQHSNGVGPAKRAPKRSAGPPVDPAAQAAPATDSPDDS